MVGCGSSVCELRTEEPHPTKVIQRLFDAFNRHDVDEMLALYQADAIHISPAFCTPRRGREEIGSVFRDLFRNIPDVHDQLVETVSEADKIVVAVEARGTTAQGQGMTLSIAIFFEIRDGLIVSERTMYDTGGSPCQQ
jgi:steroid delta-isomerase-like uncharacterized protein